MHAEMNKDAVEEHGGIPEQGDWINRNDERWLVVRVNVVNRSKVELLLEPERERREYQDFMDRSIDWPELPQLDDG